MEGGGGAIGNGHRHDRRIEPIEHRREDAVVGPGEPVPAGPEGERGPPRADAGVHHHEMDRARREAVPRPAQEVRGAPHVSRPDAVAQVGEGDPGRAGVEHAAHLAHIGIGGAEVGQQGNQRHGGNMAGKRGGGEGAERGVVPDRYRRQRPRSHESTKAQKHERTCYPASISAVPSIVVVFRVFFISCFRGFFEGAGHGQEEEAIETSGGPARRTLRQGLREGAEEAARRAGQAPGVGQAEGPEDLRRLRGARRRRQGRHDQGHHRAGQPAGVPGGGPAGADRAREDPDVHPALHAALSRPPARS